MELENGISDDFILLLFTRSSFIKLRTSLGKADNTKLKT